MTTMTAEHDTYMQRLAERAAEQLRLHELDPYRIPMYIPADDDELPCESFTAGWQQEPGA